MASEIPKAPTYDLGSLLKPGQKIRRVNLQKWPVYQNGNHIYDTYQLTAEVCPAEGLTAPEQQGQ